VGQRRVVGEPTVGAECDEVWRRGESCEARRRDGARVPEEVEFLEPGQSGERREPIVGERPVEQQREPAVAGERHREARHARQTAHAGIGHLAPGAQVAEMLLPLERADRAVARGRAHQVHALEPLAGRKVRHAVIRHAVNISPDEPQQPIPFSCIDDPDHLRILRRMSARS